MTTDDLKEMLSYARTHNLMKENVDVVYNKWVKSQKQNLIFCK